jgi:hypothetical protein
MKEMYFRPICSRYCNMQRRYSRDSGGKKPQWRRPSASQNRRLDPIFGRRVAAGLGPTRDEAPTAHRRNALTVGQQDYRIRVRRPYVSVRREPEVAGVDTVAGAESGRRFIQFIAAAHLPSLVSLAQAPPADS